MSSKPTGGDRASKKQKTDEPAKEAAVVPELNEAEKKLEDIQEELDKLEQEAAEEIIAIQKKYNQKKKPVYEKRSKVIATIPKFWAKAIANHGLLSAVLIPEDSKVFEHLENLDVADFEDVKLGFRIEFRFKENPYFQNQVLFKEFKYSDEGEFDSVTPSKIDWKPLGQEKLATQSLDENDDEQTPESFFSFWFDPRNEDTEVAEMIKEIFASPSKYYLNLVPEGEDDDDVFEGGESGDELDDDDDQQ